MNGLTTRFVYHTSGQLLAETDASNTTTREYLWLEDWPVAMVSMSGGTARLDFIHADHLGTPRRLTDSQQAVIWRWDSAPFGDSPADADPDGDSVNTVFNLRFPGQYFDSESGLHYNYFRDYDPGTGRYVQSDPIGLEAGVNTYGYANQSPLMLVDPTGETAFTAPVGFGLLALGGLYAAANSGNEATREAAQGLIDRGTNVLSGLLEAVGAINGIGPVSPSKAEKSSPKECPKDEPDECAEERAGCARMCSEAYADPNRKKVLGGSIAQCIKSCLPEKCDGEPKWKGYK